MNFSENDPCFPSLKHSHVTWQQARGNVYVLRLELLLVYSSGVISFTLQGIAAYIIMSFSTRKTKTNSHDVLLSESKYVCCHML